MEIEFKNTKKDYIDFFNLNFLQKLKKSATPLIILSILLAIIAGEPFLNWTRILYLCLCPAIWGVFYVVSYLSTVSRLTKPTLLGGSYTAAKKLKIDENGASLNYEDTGSILTLKRGDIVVFNTTKKAIYLSLFTGASIILPKNSFKSESEVEQFLMLLKKQGTKTKEQVKAIKSLKPNYWVGLFCLIPLIGAFAGFAMIFNGIFNHKDKWLVIMGVGGIAFTIFFYYYDTHSEHARKGFIPITQIELVSLMKSVELYKVNHNEYPDSLEQVQYNRSPSIVDPVQIGNLSVKDFRYYYKKQGNKYHLFSVGVDGIPNTADDIYSQMSTADTSKFGLILK